MFWTIAPAVLPYRTVPYRTVRRWLVTLRGRDDIKVQQIRKAAHTLFVRHGFAGVSTAALAHEAGISKETLYSRFPNKDAVLADVLEHLIVAGRDSNDVRVPRLETAADLGCALRSLACE